MWSIPHQKEIYQSKKFNALSTLTFSPDGQTILITNENIAQVWAFNHQQPFDDFPPIQTFRGHQNEIEHAAFSPNGQLLITSSKKKLVKIWKLGQATAIRTYQATNPILAIGFTDKNNQFLICSNKAVQRGTLSSKLLQTDFEFPVPITSATFSTNKDFILTTNKTNHHIQLWDSNRPTTSIRTFAGHTAPITALGFLPNPTSADPLIITGSLDHTCKLWQVETTQNAESIPLDNTTVLALAYSKEYIAMGCTDGTVRLWNQSTRTTKILNGHKGWVQTLTFSPQGNHLLTGSKDSTAILWDIATGESLRTFSGHSGWVYAVAISPDGTQIATGSHDKARIWQLNNRKPPKYFAGHTAPVTSVAFSPTTNHLATGSFDGQVILWGKTIDTFSVNKEVLSIAFSPDGKYLLTGCTGDNIAKLWSVDNQKELSAFVGHTDWVTSVAYLPRNEEAGYEKDYVLTGSRDKTIRLWEAGRGREIRQFKGHHKDVTAIALSPDGNLVVSSSKDASVKRWILHPDSILQQQLSQFPLSYSNFENASEFGIIDIIKQFPKSWPHFLKHADHYTIRSAGIFLYSDVKQNNNPAIYELQYKLAENCFETAMAKSNWDTIYQQQLAELYFNWSQNLKESKAINRALVKAKAAFDLSPTYEYFQNVYELATNANETTQSVFDNFIKNATHYDLRKAQVDAIFQANTKQQQYLLEAIARKEQANKKLRNTLPPSYAYPNDFTVKQQSSIAIGTFQNKTYAERLVLQAAKYGYQAKVQSITKTGKQLFQVSIPCQFDNEAAFQQIFKRIQLQFEEAQVLKMD